MEQIGNKYYYQTRGGTIKHSTLVRKTGAWLIFENGDWIPRFSPLYETCEQLEYINNLVHKMYLSTHVPDVVHIPNRFIH